MHAVKWIVCAVAVLVLMGICITVGLTLLPAGAVARTRGTFVPWLITWGMIWATTVMGVVLAGHMVGVGLGKVST